MEKTEQQNTDEAPTVSLSEKIDGLVQKWTAVIESLEDLDGQEEIKSSMPDTGPVYGSVQGSAGRLAIVATAE